MMVLLRRHYKSWGDGSVDKFSTLAEQPQSLVNLSRICIRRMFHSRRYLIGGSVDSMIDKLAAAPTETQELSFSMPQLIGIGFKVAISELHTKNTFSKFNIFQ